jgi:hypothetical protein
MTQKKLISADEKDKIRIISENLRSLFHHDWRAADHDVCSLIT